MGVTKIAKPISSALHFCVKINAATYRRRHRRLCSGGLHHTLMPQPRPASSRPATKSAAPPNSGGQGASPRLNPNDAGVKRRAANRVRRRRNNTLAWGFLIIATVVVGGAATGIWGEYQRVHEKIRVKEATLSDLRAQLERKQRRVTALDKPEGKERALVEGGYLGLGERFLLFPKDKAKSKDD